MSTTISVESILRKHELVPDILDTVPVDTQLLPVDYNGVCITPGQEITSRQTRDAPTHVVCINVSSLNMDTQHACYAE